MLIVDANSQLAEELPDITGCKMGYRSNEPAEYSGTLLENQSLCLPGTFFRVNPEPRLATSFVNGAGLVNDYIAVPQHRLDDCSDAGRLLEFDMFLTGLIHLCVYLDMNISKSSCDKG